MKILRKLFGWPKPDIAQLKATGNVNEVIAVLDNLQYPFDLHVEARDALLEIILTHHSELSQADFVRATQYAFKRMGNHYHITEKLPALINTTAAGLVDALIEVYIDVSIEMKGIMGFLGPLDAMGVSNPKRDQLSVRYWRDVHALFEAIMDISGNDGYRRLLETAQARLTDEKDKYWFNNATRAMQQEWKERYHQ